MSTKFDRARRQNERWPWNKSWRPRSWPLKIASYRAWEIEWILWVSWPMNEKLGGWLGEFWGKNWWSLGIFGAKISWFSCRLGRGIWVSRCQRVCRNQGPKTFKATWHNVLRSVSCRSKQERSWCRLPLLQGRSQNGWFFHVFSMENSIFFSGWFRDSPSFGNLPAMESLHVSELSWTQLMARYFRYFPGVVESHMMKLFEKFDISMKTQLEQLREAQVTHLQRSCSWNRVSQMLGQWLNK